MTAVSTDRLGPRQVRPTARRLSPGVRKLVLSVHVVTGVGLLGIDIAVVGLAATAATTGDVATARAAYTSMALLVHPFLPALAVSAFASGVVLSVGTKWGLLEHYWIVTKLLLNLAVILLGANAVKGLVDQAVAATAGAAPMLLVSAFSANLAMLVAATVISVYKPWGKTRQRGLRRRPLRAQVASSRSSGVRKREVTRTAPSQAPSRSAAASTAATASAPASSSSRNTISPSLR